MAFDFRNKRDLAALVGGVAAAWVVYRLVVGRRRTVDDVLALPEGQSLDLSTSDFSALEAQAFAEALPPAGQPYARLLVENGRRVGISPFILAGVMERETGYGAAGACRSTGPACIGSPRAKNPDYGLMQINAINLKAQGITQSWAEPAANIRAGANILRQTIDYFAARVPPPSNGKVDVPAWLAAKLVVAPGNKPDPRPIADARERLWYGIAGYNAGSFRVLQSVAAGRSPDAVTTGNDYGRGVLEKAERIAQRTAAILSGQGTV
jgi:hypothetical protein